MSVEQAHLRRPGPRRPLLPIIGAVAISLALPAAASHAAATLEPSRDTHVDATAPRHAHGGARTLRLSARPLRRGYLGFDLRKTGGALTKATLRLYLTGRDGGRLEVSRLTRGARWSERATTYANAPAPRAGAGAVRSRRAKRRGWVELDVTGLVALGRRSDLALRGSPAARVASSESRRPPRLVVGLADPPAPTPAPLAPPSVLAAPGGGGDASAASPGLPIRAIFDRDFFPTGFSDQAAIGFTTFDSGPWPEEMDRLSAHGAQGFVWLGGYSNQRCTFLKSDEWVRERVSAMAGHPAVAAYLIDDEPLAKECPTAPAQIKARTQLIKSIDPVPPTSVVLYRLEELALFAGTVDVLAVDRYPCSLRNGCDYSIIDEGIAELDRLGVRYWGVIQAHGDTWYRVPTPEELHQQFLRWRASRMEGYFVYAWHWPDLQPSLWLANHPELQAQLAIENALPLHAGPPG